MNACKVEIPVNVPVAVVLASLDGVEVPSQFGPLKKQVKFPTADGRALYLNLDVANRVRASVRAGEPFTLTKAQDAQRRVTWQVQKLGEQPDGTFAIQNLKAGSSPESPASIQSLLKVPVASSIPKAPNPRKRYLWDAGRELIDAYAALLAYSAEKHGGTIPAEAVRAILLSAFIQCRGAVGGRR